jgi:hypothetical protein
MDKVLLVAFCWKVHYIGPRNAASWPVADRLSAMYHTYRSLTGRLPNELRMSLNLELAHKRTSEGLMTFASLMQGQMGIRD